MELSKYGFTSIDHMTHIDNLDTIFKNGLLAHNNPYKKVDISNQAVNSRRKTREPIYGRKVQEYVPFYFNPRNAMMYKNKDEDIVILAFNAELLLLENTIFTDRNASTRDVEFFNKIKDLDIIDWEILNSYSWYNRPNIVKQTMMAEVLAPRRVSMKYFKNIYCKDLQTKKILTKKYNLYSNQIMVEPYLFFN